ncbi:DUF4232 domain-containing protein [Streptomyces sp. NBC_00859]|uniref:DUF4232 domain-containing protein n=1 Tax=Streptomyces sp. NBC_00859 TaxID=2903682 RepID=UPI003866CCD2|nr:DUF4232 domain-containing protein [Streptomyces sp. NBC_00859]
MRVHKLTFAALAVAAGLSLTACQNDDAGAGQSDSSSASGAPSGSSASSSGSGSGSDSSDQGGGKESAGSGSNGKNAAAGTGSDAAGRAAKCRTDDLAITAKDNTIGGDTDATVVVELTNHSGRDCAISGYAGVDLKTTSGPLSAKRTGQEGSPGILKNGRAIDFPITYPFNKSGGSGIRVTGLVVTPPDETKSVTLSWPGARTLPITDGSGSPVKIGPIGSAGQGG